MPHKINQKGFAAVEAVLIVIVIALVGGSGYFVWKAQKVVNTTYSNASKVAQSTPEKVTKKTNTSPQPQSYLVIKEWGVKVPLSDAIKDAYYIYTPKTQGSGGYVRLSLDAFKGTGCAADSTSIGEYSRLQKGDDDGFGNPFTPTESTPLVGSYYYEFIGAQAACSDDSAVSAKSLAARAGFQQAIKSVVAE